MSPATQVVVVADDDRVTRRVLSALLERHGYEVHTAADGDETLALVKALRPSALFDAMMPPPDGYEVCALIRADSDLAATQPVIVMVTAAGQEADRARAVEAGVDDFVTKPFSPSQLSAKLQQLVPPS
jgi:CheY-like chemotaxis protein